MTADVRLPMLDSPAHRTLTAALTNAVARDLFVPCAGPWDGDSPWLSDDPDERRWAARLCADCPVLGDCRRAGELERWGVWGAIDQTPPSSSKSLRKPNPQIPHHAHCKRPRPVLRRSWAGSPELYCPGCGRAAHSDAPAEQGQEVTG